jgi:nucleotide-binding universal stress UspA family protein
MMASEKIEQGLVVVGVDGSPHSVAALHWAARYAAATGAAVRAVHAWHYPDGLAPAGMAPDLTQQETQALMRRSLDEAIAEVYPGQVPAQVEAQLGFGHAAQVLIDMSKDADLLVVGGSGHGGFTGMLLGSVSNHCMHGALCPVTVVRGPGITDNADR